MKPKELKEGEHYTKEDYVLMEMLPENWETVLTYDDKLALYTEWTEKVGLLGQRVSFNPFTDLPSKESLMDELISIHTVPSQPVDLAELDKPCDCDECTGKAEPKKFAPWYQKQWDQTMEIAQRELDELNAMSDDERREYIQNVKSELLPGVKGNEKTPAETAEYFNKKFSSMVTKPERPTPRFIKESSDTPEE